MQQQQTIERKAKRTTERFVGTVNGRHDMSRGIVKDLSPAGICFQLYFDVTVKTGEEVTIDSDELGHLTGVVRWYRGDRIGIKLHLSSNSAAQVESYYKFFR